jgi:fucose 4-O-acetylase-like acetyltransferase
VSTLTLERSHAPAPPRSRTPRDPWFDNAKMLLVLLVVVGHSWTLLPDTVLNARLYDWLYLWHMPAFVLVTGYLSKRFTWSRRNLRRLVTTVVLPYFILEGLLALFRVHVGGEKLERLWLNPHWPMWFLAALFFWRLATPVLRRVPHPLALAVVVSALSGLFATELLDTNRVLGLLPFYVLGLVVEKHHVDAVRTQHVRLLGLLVLAGGAWFVSQGDGLSAEWLYYRSSYSEMGAGFLEGAATRVGLMVLAVAMGVAALSWLPGKGGWFTRMGSASLVVYLFHGFFVKGAEYAGVMEWAAAHPFASLLAVTAGSAALALALAWRPVAKPLEKIVTPAP